MAQQLADPRACARPDFWAQRHERVERGRGEHTEFADIEPAILFELPEIEHVIADRSPDARGKAIFGREYAVREILDREIGCGIDRDEGAEGGIVGVGHGFSGCAINAETGAVSVALPWRGRVDATRRRRASSGRAAGWGDALSF